MTMFKYNNQSSTSSYLQKILDIIGIHYNSDGNLYRKCRLCGRFYSIDEQYHNCLLKK